MTSGTEGSRHICGVSREQHYIFAAAKCKVNRKELCGAHHDRVFAILDPSCQSIRRETFKRQRRSRGSTVTWYVAPFYIGDCLTLHLDVPISATTGAIGVVRQSSPTSYRFSYELARRKYHSASRYIS